MVFAGKTVEDGVDLYPSFEINFAGIKRFKIKMAANCETIFLIIFLCYLVKHFFFISNDERKTETLMKNREMKSRASKAARSFCILLYSHSSFVVDWQFKHAANCWDFIIINLFMD